MTRSKMTAGVALLRTPLRPNIGGKPMNKALFLWKLDQFKMICDNIVIEAVNYARRGANSIRNLKSL